MSQIINGVACLTIQEAMKDLGASYSTIRTYIANERLQGFIYLGLVRIPEESVKAFKENPISVKQRREMKQRRCEQQSLTQ